MLTVSPDVKQQIIVPDSKEEWLKLRTEDVTSTEIAALFGVSPYITHFELWHQKKARTVVAIEENERMKWGTRLQDSIAQGIAADNGWPIRRMDEYIRNSILRIGASFDFSIEPEARDRVSINLIGPDHGLLEIKNVDSLAFRDGWLIDDETGVEAPPHIELQVQHQLMVSQRSFAYIGALIGGNRVTLIKREPEPRIFAAIEKEVGKFWASIEAGIAPAPDFQRDAEFIATLYGYAQPGKIMDARGDTMLETKVLLYRKYGAEEGEAEQKKKAVKAEILTIIGDHEKVIGDTFSITAGVCPEAPIAFIRKPYRMFKPTFKKQK